jgi:hypothetical protein
MTFEFCHELGDEIQQACIGSVESERADLHDHRVLQFYKYVLYVNW